MVASFVYVRRFYYPICLLFLMKEIRRSPVDMVNVSHDLQGFQHHLRWLGMGFLNHPARMRAIFIGFLRGGGPRGGGSLMFPKVPQSSLGILRVS